MSLKTAAAAVADESPQIEELEQTIRMLEEQVTTLQSRREDAGSGPAADSEAMVASLEAQLVVLYEDLSQLDGRSVAELIETLHSLEAQLHALYQERSETGDGPSAAEEMVASLEAQVAALIEERDALAEALEQSTLALTRTRSKAKEVVATMLECCLD